MIKKLLLLSILILILNYPSETLCPGYMAEELIKLQQQTKKDYDEKNTTNDSIYIDSPNEADTAAAVKNIPPVKLPASKRHDDLGLTFIPFVYNSLYSIRNIKDPDHAIEVLSKFSYLVCAEPGHLTDEELLVADSIKDSVRIFGYINMGGNPLPSLDKLRKEIDNIYNNGWYGVFIDQFGYDFGETRQRQNIIVDYAHSKGLKCFVNSWFIEDALGTEIDIKHNPKGEETHLAEGDWYLIESFLTSNKGYNSNVEQSIEKYLKAKYYKDTIKINVAALSYKRDDISWDKAKEDIRLSYILSVLLGFDGWWYTDRLELDDFNFGHDPGLFLGDTLEVSLRKDIYPDNWYIAQTDAYVFTFDFNKYPVIRYNAYDNISIKNK